MQNDESSEAIPEFKVWNLNKLNKSIPACVKSAKTNIQRPTALGVSENGQHMAIGFERGNISIYFGDMSRDKTKAVKNVTFGNTAIKGIAFKQMGKIVHMFVCSDSGVYLYTIQGRDKEIKNVLDTVSANITTSSCCLQMAGANSEGYFMVGRDDAVYCYTPEGRAPCYAFDGRKVLVRWFRSHLLMVTSSLRENQTQTLTVIDVTNRFIVFTAQIDPVHSVFIEFGSCFILTKNKVMYSLDEKDLQSKLNSLYKKNMFDTAVKIAKNSQYDDEGLSDIFKNYADHLYGKGNFGSAMEQYIKTIGFLEPSYVIRRFLDPRHTQYLTDYLQNIHKQGKASTDHTTLLLNCYTRLDRVEELKCFLENYKQNNFDIGVAINVCRKSCVEQALELAKFNKKHDYTVTILIEDLKFYEDAIEEITKLSYDDAERNIMKYGNILMKEASPKMIALLKKLCTDYIAKKCESTTDKKDIFGDESNSASFGGYRNGGFLDEREQATPEDFIRFFDDSKQLIDYVEYLIRNLPTCSSFLYNSLIEHYLTLWKMADIPANERQGLEQRLVDLIKNQNKFYDHNHVLVLCQTYEFWLGAMLIYEEKKLYNLIVRHYLSTKDYSSLYTLCKRLGTSDPSIWLHTLNGLRISSQVPSSFLQEILQVIASEKLLSPLQVLNVLTAIENGPTLSNVRSYFLQIFQKEEEIIQKDRALAEKYHKESEELKRKIEILDNEPIEFRGSLCDACHQPLNFPALFFLCKHSFHQDCLRSFSETEKDCMMCRKKNSQLLETIFMHNDDRHKDSQKFHEKLGDSHEPFSVIAENFSRGLFNKIVLLSDDEDENKVAEKVPSKPEIGTQKQHQLPQISESRIRLEENLKTNIEHKPQLSEGRLRLQERGFGTKPIEKVQAAPLPRAPQSKPFEPKRKQEVKATYPISANPFGDEDDDDKNPFKDNVGYDDTLNPFGDDDTGKLIFFWRYKIL